MQRTVFRPWGGGWGGGGGGGGGRKTSRRVIHTLGFSPLPPLTFYVDISPPPTKYASPTAQYTNTNRVINPSPDSCVSFPGWLYLMPALLWKKKKKSSPPEWLNANWLMWLYSPCVGHRTQKTHKAAQLLHEPVCLRWPMHIKDTFPFSQW